MDWLWGDRFAEPIYVLTADQDWAPEWATERLLAFAGERGLPLHVFATNSSPALERAVAAGTGVTRGIHPNFLPGSTHGESAEEVIATCREIAPEARTFRTHAYAEDSYSLDVLRRAGFETDSNLCLFLQPAIVPLLHATGILRLPVFLDDDSLLLWDTDEGGLDLEPMAKAIASPGLKILNFHPLLFAINCPAPSYYRARRDALYEPGTEPAERFEGRGTADVLEDLIARIEARGAHLASFPDLAENAWRTLRERADPALYAWGRPDRG